MLRLHSIQRVTLRLLGLCQCYVTACYEALGPHGDWV